MIIAGLIGPATAIGAPAGDALYKKQCGACHTIIKDGGRRQGPNLYNLMGRTVGNLDKFKYSKDLAASNDVWTPALLDQWLTKPKAVYPSTYMLYKQPDAAIRADIISYISTFKD